MKFGGNSKFFIQISIYENAFQNVDNKISTILFRPHWVNYIYSNVFLSVIHHVFWHMLYAQYLEKFNPDWHNGK